MKKTLFLALTLCTLCFCFPIAADDTAAGAAASAVDEGMPQFGLQADIFRNVRGIDPGQLTNFSDMRDYQLTPGDLFNLTVTSGVRSDGSISNVQEYEIQLQSNYQLNLPFIGTINARGFTLSTLQQYVVNGIRNIIPAQYINFVLAQPAQFNVFVYGGVVQPGFVLSTPLTGVLEAIAAVGGFKPGGSYRKVQIYRASAAEGDNEGEPLVIDISEFYKSADFSANPTLEPGDKIYIPPAEIIANISGNIAFPGSYELVEGESLAELLTLAGGVLPDTLESKIEIQRIGANGRRTLISTSIEKAEQELMRKGDAVVIHSTSEISEMITIEGAILGQRRTDQNILQIPDIPVRLDLPYYPGINLLTVLDSVGGPSPYLSTAEDSYIIRKKTDGEEKIVIDAAELWESREKQYNTELFPGDIITLPMQIRDVFITGNVSNPGAYPYVDYFTVSDYLLAAGGIEEITGDPDGIYLLDIFGSQTKLTYTDSVQPGSRIYVARRPLVFLTGYVNSPGDFPYSPENTVYDYLLLAGGITENTGDPNGIFLIDRAGKRKKIKMTDTVSPEDNIYVSKKILFSSDQFVQNLLITTGWVTAIIAVVNTVWDFIDRIRAAE